MTRSGTSSAWRWTVVYHKARCALCPLHQPDHAWRHALWRSYCRGGATAPQSAPHNSCLSVTCVLGRREATLVVSTASWTIYSMVSISHWPPVQQINYSVRNHWLQIPTNFNSIYYLINIRILKSVMYFSSLLLTVRIWEDLDHPVISTATMELLWNPRWPRSRDRRRRAGKR